VAKTRISATGSMRNGCCASRKGEHGCNSPWELVRRYEKASCTATSADYLGGPAAWQRTCARNTLPPKAASSKRRTSIKLAIRFAPGSPRSRTHSGHRRSGAAMARHQAVSLDDSARSTGRRGEASTADGAASRGPASRDRLNWATGEERREKNQRRRRSNCQNSCARCLFWCINRGCSFFLKLSLRVPGTSWYPGRHP